MAVYFFYGDEDFNIDLAIDEMKSKLNQDFIAMNFQTLDNPEYPTLINVLRTPPMMFGDTLIVISAEKYFSPPKNSTEKYSFDDTELEDIDDALKNNPEGLNIVFTVKLPRDENKKIDSRRKIYKILSKYNPQEFAAFKFYEDKKIIAWLKSRAKKKGLTLNEDAAELLTENIGTNLRQFDIELDKLKLIAYPQDIVTKEMVTQIAITNQDLFNITDALILNQKDKALSEFKKLTDKKHPLEILSAIQTMLRKWIILKTTKASTFELARLTGMKENQIPPTMAKLRNTNASDLVKMKQNLFNAEYKLKSADSADINSEVEIALIR